MVESRKSKRILWIISLTLGPIVYCILLLALPGTPNFEIIRNNIIDLVFTFIIYWVVVFVLVWAWYLLGKFVIKYGPFV